MPRRWAAPIFAATILALQLPSLREVVAASRPAGSELLTARRAIRAVVGKSDSLFAFDPSWSLAAGRLPPHGDNAPVVVDSYALMLNAAIKDKAHLPDTNTAFQRGASQPDVRARLDASPFVILGWRGNWQMNAEDRDWFGSRFLCLTPEAGDLCVWKRAPQPFSGIGVVYSGRVEFGEGWYFEEGRSPSSWRWMGSRSVTTLPAIDGPVLLQLYLHVPLEALPSPPALSISLDGKQLDQFKPQSGNVVRSYSLPIQSGPFHTLVVATDRTFSPTRTGSQDSRELGLSVQRIVWLSSGR